LPQHAPLKGGPAKRAAPSDTTALRASGRDVAPGKPAPGPTFDIRTLPIHPPMAVPQPVQRATLPNRTGLPDRLKSGIEALSGFAMDDVRVHRNSSKPAKLGALAYARGSEIHIGVGQDHHLPHEAWHLVQQRQGRVKATGRAGSTPINDDASLERESDAMGARAASFGQGAAGAAAPSAAAPAAAPAAPAQLSRGSRKANEDLVKAMGKSGDRVLKQPKAKPHTKMGTGSGGTDHQGRNANVINKAKQDTRYALEDPTMFSSSRMRADDRAAEKDPIANEKREEKKKVAKLSKEEQIRHMFGLDEDEEITNDHRKAFTELS
jgi:hypothetical protein